MGNSLVMDEILIPIILTDEERDHEVWMERNTGYTHGRDIRQCAKFLDALIDAHILSRSDIYIAKIELSLKEYAI